LFDQQKPANFVKKISKDKEQLIHEAVEISGDIRYIDVYDDDGISMKQRSDTSNGSSNESDKYDEHLVNPVLIKLASQRGTTDCGA